MISAITEYLEELKESFAPTIAKAEDEQEGGEEESSEEKADGEEGGGEEGGDNEDSNDEEGDEEDEDEEEDDEEEEEEEGGDPLDALKAECANTTEGKELTHHFMECVERVHKAEEQPGYEDAEYKEDCVEEFFHLTHYVDNCAAPRLFGKLK